MKKIWLLLAIIALLLLGLVAYFYLHQRQGPATSSNTPTFPSGSATGGAPSYDVTTTSGTTLTVHDFIDNGETIPDFENKGRYLLAGDLGYCQPDTPCTAASSTVFNIFYTANDHAFTVGLLTEPLGAARDEAEAFLLSRLGISHSQLCTLNVYVGTAYWVNEQYASGNLGFKDCPNAVKLP